MSQVDQVTQRNASAAEELASTAEEMAAQAEALQQLVSTFRLSESALPARPVAAAGGRPPAARASGDHTVARTNGGLRPSLGTVATFAHEGAPYHDPDFKRF